ncbi:catalase-like domain-containing protein, partial [Schizophyllum commune]
TKKYANAGFPNDLPRTTPVSICFSYAHGSRGSADAAHHVRGFAAKFCTNDGNWDSVGHNVPSLVIQDSIKFSASVYAVLKPEPHSEITQGRSAHNDLWDLIGLQPKASHAAMRAMSDPIIPRFYRFPPSCWTGHSESPARISVLERGLQQRRAGEEASAIQTIAEKDVRNLEFDILDGTKVRSEELVAFQPSGKDVVLNHSVGEHPQETEQVAFCIRHAVLGVDFGSDSLLKALFYDSLTDFKKAHVLSVLSSTVFVYELYSYVVSSVGVDLAKNASLNVGSETPTRLGSRTRPRRATRRRRRTTSRRKPTIKSRRIAILIADGLSRNEVQAAMAALSSAGAAPVLFGPRGRILYPMGVAVRAEGGIMADQCIEGQRLTLFIPSGREVKDAEVSNGRCIHWVLDLTKIDKTRRQLKALGSVEKIDQELMKHAGKMGFSDSQIAGLVNSIARAHCKSHAVTPFIERIDTLAADFPAHTNYLYTTYNPQTHDVEFDEHSTMVLCSGAVVGSKTIMINYDPETASTDFDEAHRLYFEEPGFERVMDIYELERAQGAVVSVGGQLPQNVALRLKQNNANVLGTDPQQIDNAEDRHKFSAVIDSIGLDQPAWTEATFLEDAKAFTDRVGCPVLIRPSYVLCNNEQDETKW